MISPLRASKSLVTNTIHTFLQLSRF